MHNHLEVVLLPGDVRDNAMLATAANDAFAANVTVPTGVEAMALQWEAIAADGKLFTALLADLMLIPAGDQTTAVSVTGTYWPPPGRAGAGLGQAIVRRCATAVIGSFLDLVACELVHPAGMAGPLAGR